MNKKEVQRQEIAAEIEVYLKAGGVIVTLPCAPDPLRPLAPVDPAARWTLNCSDPTLAGAD